ncbi:hypothetical protein F4801DRAFT_150590 [Xylaria longipes]|nr:hypothetical protein F4801DRAFT_150590 [Xylaria longipes]
MEPATPEKQKSPGVSAPVEAMPETQSQPAADICASGPTTPEKQETHDVSVPGDTALESQSVLNDTVTTPTSQEQGSPDSPPLRGIDLVSFTLPVHEFITGLIIDTFVEKLIPMLRKLITNAAYVLGCTRAIHTEFIPPTAEIREKLSSFPDVDAKYIADMTVNMMLMAWKNQCLYVIQRYQSEMRTDLFKKAREKSEALKPEVLEAVEAKVRDLEQPVSDDQPRPTTPTGPTPNAQAPPTTPTVDDINTAIESLGISRSPIRIRNLGRLESPACLRVPRTPKATPTPTAPSRFGTPQSQRSRNSVRMTPRPRTPAESPLKARAPPGHEHAGMLGPYQVFSPVCCRPRRQLEPEPED